jgi:Flp pilus assembly protein TadD
VIGMSRDVSHRGVAVVMGAILGAVRIILIVAALLAGGWLATQVRAARAESELTKVAFADTHRGDVPDLLDADRLLNPDRRPDLFAGVILGRQGDYEGAVRALQTVTTAEPQNIEAWGLLAAAAKRTDPGLAAEAAATARRLSPPVR